MTTCIYRTSNVKNSRALPWYMDKPSTARAFQALDVASISMAAIEECTRLNKQEGDLAGA